MSSWRDTLSGPIPGNGIHIFMPWLPTDYSKIPDEIVYGPVEDAAWEQQERPGLSGQWFRS